MHGARGRGSCRHWKGPGEDFFFFLSFFVEREKLGRQNLLFPLCNVVGDIWGFFLSYFPASITLKWPASVGPECPVQPLTVYMVYTSVVV